MAEDVKVTGESEETEERKLATAADFLKDYKTEQMKVIEGIFINIRSLPAADMLVGFGGMLALEMQKAGKDFEDEKTRTQFIENLDPNQTQRLLIAQWDGIKENVCKAVESLQLTMKPQSDCSEGELSIDSLSKPTIWQIWRRVKVLSGFKDPGEVIWSGLEE